jgi:hypothetical protein
MTWVRSEMTEVIRADKRLYILLIILCEVIHIYLHIYSYGKYIIHVCILSFCYMHASIMNVPAGHILAINDELGRVLDLYSRVLSAQTNAIARGAKPNEPSLLGLQLGTQQGGQL